MFSQNCQSNWNLLRPICLSLQHFEQDDPELYLTKIRYIEENDVNDMELTFSEEEYEGSTLSKVPDEEWNHQNHSAEYRKHRVPCPFHKQSIDLNPMTEFQLGLQNQDLWCLLPK